MISDDVTDGCAPPPGRVLAPCEICATSFRLKKITGRPWNPTSRGEGIRLAPFRGARRSVSSA